MISHDPDHQPMNKFHVRIGYATVKVVGTNRSDAIQTARQRLCLEMPRMWDVIQSIDESRFQVDDAN